ncbi:hypothetical protein PC129_g17393 [Phytophthora cactorum]|uniref:Uncharacterized protein n=1 Tax=Phytophthora cactorum TaxID=29920 RepID=A0A8T1HHP3_9STRA|nr:hypothetical protein PC115_g17983 [Phytophthora cactorum]KAG3211629.1 hypothetical protein PC129_g17393 [Phytophthora cactorum]
MANTSDAGFLLGYLEECMECKVYFPQYRISRVVYTVRVHEDSCITTDMKSPNPWITDGQTNKKKILMRERDRASELEESDGDAQDHADYVEMESSVTEEELSSDSSEESDGSEDSITESAGSEPPASEPYLMQPHVFLRPMTEEMDRQEAKTNADTGDEGNSEHEDVIPEDEKCSSEPAPDGKSESSGGSGGSSSDDHKTADEELRDYDDVVEQEIDNSHAEPQNVEQEPYDSRDMDIETYELDDVDEMMNQKRILEDRIRLFSKRPV